MFIYRIVPTGHVSKILASLALVIAVIVPCVVRAGGVTIVLSNRFINTYANRATIDATVDIAYAAQRPHSNATDGDEHASRNVKKIGLVTVVEIMNAREPDERNAVAELGEGGNKTVSIVGFWRLWPEHAGAADFVQSDEADEITNTNPPHVFEIHPVLTIDGIPVEHSLQPIADYPVSNAADAFAHYDAARCEISRSLTTTTISTKQLGNNYVAFELAFTDESTLKPTDDGGYEFFGEVRDPRTHSVLEPKVRMIAAPGTSIKTHIAKIRPGDTLVVWGIPRIDLSLVGYRAKHPTAAHWSLPYEMMLVGIE